MHDFLIELQAKLDDLTSKENINSDIGKLQKKIDELKIQTRLDPDSVAKLAREIEELVNSKITISNIDIDTRQIGKSGQKAGQEFADGIERGINKNISALDSFKKSLQNIGMGSEQIEKIAKQIKNLDVQIESLNQSTSQSKNKNILSVNISGIDKMGQAVKITEQYNTVNGDLIKRIDSVSTAQKKAGISSENFVKKQKLTIANLQNSINKITSRAFDKNSSKPIKSDSSIEKLQNQVERIEQSMNNLRQSTSETFDDIKLKVKEEISQFEILESKLRKADNVSNKMRGTDYSSGLSIAKHNLEKFKIDSKDFSGMTQTIKELDSAIEKVGDSSSLNSFNDQLKVARAELEKVKAEAKSSFQSTNIVDAVNRGDYDKKLKVLQASYERLGLASDEVKEKTNNVSVALEKLNYKNLDSIVNDEKEFSSALKKSQNELAILKTNVDSIYNTKRQLKLSTDIQNWLSKNSRASADAKRSLTEYFQELNNGRVSVDRLEYIRQELQKIDAQQRGLGKIGKNLKDQFSEAAKGFTQWLSISSGVMLLISKTRSAITEITELDNILTEISKTSDMTSNQLKQLGMNAYDSASKYGRTASDYLLGVQEMNRSGFYGNKGTGMAEQSLLAQSAGDMDAELADKYILATNAAYKLNGEADKLNAVLDGQNSITNRNSVSMENMATAMTETGTVAAGYRVKVEDLSAMIGTIESVTKLGGSEVGNALKAILINLQNVTSSKIVDTLDKANASMTEMVNGTEKLRNPIAILRDLSKTFNQLNEDDPMRAEILTNIGQKYHANKLGALLQNMDMFDKMLVDYSEGEGSAFAEAEKSTNNLTGSINKLNNSWTEFVNSVVNSDGLKTGVNSLNNLVKAFTNITSSGQNLRTTILAIIGTIAQFKSKSGGLMRLIPIVNNSPFLATVEFNSDVYDSYVCA